MEQLKDQGKSSPHSRIPDEVRAKAAAQFIEALHAIGADTEIIEIAEQRHSGSKYAGN